MQHRIATIVLAAAISAWPTAQAQVIQLAEITPKCPAPFKEKPEGGKCVTDDVALKAIKDEDCNSSWLKFDKDAAQKCSVITANVPAPACGNALPDLSVKDGKCVVERKTARSSTNDYLGDCFAFRSLPGRGDFPFRATDAIRVVADREAPGSKDKLLTVALSDGVSPFSCRAKEGSKTVELAANQLLEIGAYRYGWAYGVLALPYKYYGKGKKFGDGLTIGPYLGWRYGVPGASTTYAVSAGLSRVKGEVTDAKGNVGAPDLSALSYAIGVMWDLRPSPNAKPFKIGLFVGADRVSADKAVSFAQNGKPWIAFQIGYDFTDN